MREIYLHEGCKEAALTKRYPEVCERCQGRVVNTIVRQISEATGKPLTLHTGARPRDLYSCHDAFMRMRFNDMCWTCLEQILSVMKKVLKGEAE